MKFKTKPTNLLKLIAINIDKIITEYGDKDITVEVKEWRAKRSLDQNALMWAILDKIAKKLNLTADEVYFDMLKDYGVCDYLAVPENSKNLNAILDTLKYYVIEESTLEKVKRIKVFIGSSHYDTKQMTVLIDGILQECENIGLDVSYESAELKSLLESKKCKINK